MLIYDLGDVVMCGFVALFFFAFVVSSLRRRRGARSVTRKQKTPCGRRSRSRCVRRFASTDAFRNTTTYRTLRLS